MWRDDVEANNRLKIEQRTRIKAEKTNINWSDG